MIRFSLTTLLLVAFWIAAVMLVWAWREPWVQTELLPKAELLERRLPYVSLVGDVIAPVAPDGIRTAAFQTHDFGDGRVGRKLIVTTSPFGRDYTVFSQTVLPVVWDVSTDAYFINDDLIVICAAESDVPLVCLRRRFPEWWWGHFYRPEVWLTLALTGVLLWRAVRFTPARVEPETKNRKL